MRELTYNEAALEAVAEEMRRDSKIFYMSTDALPPLLNEFGPQRIKATPITEAAFTGIGIGAAGCGFRPIAAASMRSMICAFRPRSGMYPSEISCSERPRRGSATSIVSTAIGSRRFRPTLPRACSRRTYSRT